MNINLADWQIALLLVLITAILVVWFRSMLASRSQSRMYRMMARVGVFPRSDKSTGLDMQAVRMRCRRCPAEDVCERWLAGEIEGDNGFCPNAGVFEGAVKGH
jgi:Family of unknown function (DUF6455)